MIPYGRQSVSRQDIDAVVEVLGSDWLTQGPLVGRFESALADCCGAGHAVAVSSGTAALHLACLALDLGPGDRLWTSPITFVASANCALYCGAEVGFVDIDPQSRNLCVNALEARLQVAAGEGRLPKIVVPVHFAGQSCDMVRIHALAQRYGFRVIEDAAHALGGSYRDHPVGCGRYADITVFSFHPLKSITTGEGGALLVNDPQLYERLLRLRSHGVSRDTAQFNDTTQGGWYHEQIELGYNYRISDIQAALGLSQLPRLDAFVAARRRLARRYDRLLQDLPLSLPPPDPQGHSAWHLYAVCFEGGSALRRQVYDALEAAGIRSQVHYIPVHRQPLYAARGFREGDYPHAEQYYAGALSLPLYPDMTEAQQDRVVSTLRQVLSA